MAHSLPETVIVIGGDAAPGRSQAGLDELSRCCSLLVVPLVSDAALLRRSRPVTAGVDWGVQDVALHIAHTTAIDLAIASGAESVLVLDRRLELAPTSLDNLVAFFREVPSNWGFAVIAGTFLFPSLSVSSGVVRPEHFRCEQGYAVRRSAYSVLQGALRSRQALLHAAISACQGMVPVYAPATPLVPGL